MQFTECKKLLVVIHKRTHGIGVVLLHVHRPQNVHFGVLGATYHRPRLITDHSAAGLVVLDALPSHSCIAKGLRETFFFILNPSMAYWKLVCSRLSVTDLSQLRATSGPLRSPGRPPTSWVDPNWT